MPGLPVHHQLLEEDPSRTLNTNRNKHSHLSRVSSIPFPECGSYSLSMAFLFCGPSPPAPAWQADTTFHPWLPVSRPLHAEMVNLVAEYFKHLIVCLFVGLWASKIHALEWSKVDILLVHSRLSIQVVEGKKNQEWKTRQNKDGAPGKSWSFHRPVYI